MSTGSHTEQTEQRVLNDAKDALYNTIDVTPFVETTVGSEAQRVTGTVVGDKVAQDVSISDASLPLPTGAATSAKQLPDGHNVTVDNAAGAAAVNIQDGGNTITVDGSVALSNSPSVYIKDTGGNLITPAQDSTLFDVVNATEGIQIALGTAEVSPLQYSTNDRLKTIGTSVELIDNAVDGNYLNINNNIAGTDVAAGAGTINAQTQRVTIATDDEVNNFLGTIDADTSTLAGAVAGTEMQVDVVTMPAVTISNGSINGSGAPTIDSYSRVAINLAAGANQSLVSAPGANKQIWVYGIGFTTNVAGTVSFQDEDDTAVTGIMQIGATGGMTVAPSGNFAMPLWKIATNKALEVDVVTAELDGWLTYAIVSV